MPIVRVDIPFGHSPAVVASLRALIRQAVETALAPKEKRYEYVSIREVHAEPGDGAPTVTLDLRPGRDAKRKTHLVRLLEEVFSHTLGTHPRDLYVLFREVEAANHYCGGEPLPDWVPADAS